MNSYHYTDRAVDSAQRATTAAALAKYYAEEAGRAESRGLPAVGPAALILQLAESGAVMGHSERVVCNAAAEAAGRHFDTMRPLVQFDMLRQHAGLTRRDLTAANASGGGYLVGTQMLTPTEQWQPWSVTARAGVTFVDAAPGAAVIPFEETPPAVTFVGAEGTGPAPTQPVIGQAAMTMKTGIGQVQISRQALLQANADRFASRLLMRVGAEVIDTALLGGSGSAGQPMGICNLSQIGGPPGTSLTYDDIVTMLQIAVADGADQSRLHFVAGLNAFGLLAVRLRDNRAMWEGTDLAGYPADATRCCPSTSLVVGDWTRAVVALWSGGITLSVDPFTGFKSGVITVRVAVDFDVALPTPANAGFAVCNAIT